jgi:uncharacterized phage protein (TIGR01671 family)
MNREIKFRGKRIDNGEWVYGDLLQPTEICDIYEIANCESIDGTRYEVIPETIGQYTGLHDENGKEIYEGDIIAIDYLTCIVTGVIKYSTEYSMYILINTNSIADENEPLGDYTNKKLEVIGNVTDSPELLGGE